MPRLAELLLYRENNIDLTYQNVLIYFLTIIVPML